LKALQICAAYKPAFIYGGPTIVIESPSVGTPVPVSERFGLADYVSKNNMGWICKTNPESVGESINNIAKNYKANIARIRQDAPTMLYEDFKKSDLAKKYINIYNQLVKQ
jgi:glycosyltransferase involved in cell wall biosynthesis